LLGKLFGGGEELSWLDFAPGQFEVTANAEPKLKSLATALAERPGLKLDISGSVDPQTDREALSQARVESKLRALKRKDLAEQGKLVTGAEVVVSAQERPELLKRSYETEFEAKSGAPKVGPTTLAAARAEAAAAAKRPQPSQQEMEQFLRTNQQISDDDLLALGNQRAQAVKQWLGTIGLVPEDRMALVAAKIAARPEETAASAPVAPSGTATPATVEAAPAAASAARSASRVNFALH